MKMVAVIAITRDQTLSDTCDSSIVKFKSREILRPWRQSRNQLIEIFELFKLI